MVKPPDVKLCSGHSCCRHQVVKTKILYKLQ